MNPTDLDDTERRHAHRRLREMADELARQGVLRDRALRVAFENTWRHPYVPAYYPDADTPAVLCIDDTRRAEWLDTVYSDVTLITKVVRVPLSRPLRPATVNTYTSSSTLPYVVVEMLEHLDLRDGHRVLEIGTGSGYNAALLCARLGDRAVTSVDIDDELVEAARERLAANGHRPTLAVADGADGFPRTAPYDRIVATCAVPAVPPAWLEQAAPGAVILADVHGPLGGTLVRLAVDAAGAASGRFFPAGYGFMTMRHGLDGVPAGLALRDGATTSGWTAVDPSALGNGGAFAFLAQWHLPGIRFGTTTGEDGRPAAVLVAADGSHAEIAFDPGPRGYRTTERGNGRLVERLEGAADFWRMHDRPGPQRFGLTATAAAQHVWFDRPDGPRWTLPPAETNGG